MRRLAALGLALLLAACQAPPAPPSTAKPARDLAAEAQAALARGDWAAGAPLFREALTRDAASVTLHYGLAVCASYLDAVDEATHQFRWVLEHAAPGSEEAKIARSWLAQSRERAPASESAAATDNPTVGEGVISGHVTWGDAGQRRGRERQLVLLQGVRGTPTAGLLYRTRTDERGQYELKRIVPGSYKVTDAIAGPATWRLKVTIEPGRPTVMDLGPENSLPARDDFPEAGRAG